MRSIYAPLWTLTFLHQGRTRLDCDWVRVQAQPKTTSLHSSTSFASLRFAQGAL
ncbi:hypothetical protein GGP73_000395 [Salinibacter ruber]|nr:hypothetical protein [Salinibacter ruber]